MGRGAQESEAMALIIREANNSDASAIAKVHVDSWRTTYRGLVPDDFLASLSYEQRQSMWERHLNNTESGTFVYVAEDESGQVVGFVSGGPERTRDTVYKGEIYAIYLLEAHQRRGIGRGLFEAVVDRLERAGLQSMLVWVLEDNPSRRFYESLGGELAGKQQITIGAAELTEVAYGWADIRAFQRRNPT
jgi:L-amino acid N-acyltransferase YncA